MIPTQASRSLGCPANIASITPSCAEQGIARESSKVAMTRSRLVSNVRVVIVAMVSQPKPNTIGMTARPLKTNFLECPVDQHRKAWQVAAVLDH